MFAVGASDASRALPSSAPASIDVVIPTYRRPELLDRCLGALTAQARPADCVLVVARQQDTPSHAVVERFVGRLPGLELVRVGEPGTIAAMTAGVARSRSNVIAFTDDDAAPHPDWLARFLDHFADSTVGAVGGRDVIPGQEDPLTDDVGRFRRSGRLTGMHHLGTGPSRDVDVLKGVNMAFRAEALAFPTSGLLRGSGAQIDFEVITCAWASERGWRIVYDPAVQVDHEGAVRHGGDRRQRPAPSAVFDAGFNSVVAASVMGRSAVLRHAGYGVAVGTRDRPGVIRAAVALPRGDREVVRRAGPALAGRLTALVWLLARPFGRVRPLVVTAAELRNATPVRPRVVLVAHDIHDGGGMERANAELLRSLRREFDFEIVSATLAEDLRPLVAWRRIRVPRRPFTLKFLWFFARAGIEVRRMNAGLVHTLGAIIPNRADVASVHFCHAGYRGVSGGSAPAYAPPLRQLNATVAGFIALLAERWCYRPTRVRALAAVSEGVRREVEDHYPGVPVTVTPNGVDTDRFRPDPGERPTTRERLGAGPNVCVALFVGGDWGRKGLAMAVEAVAKARADGVPVVLWVVGRGDEVRLAALAGDLGIEDAVWFFGGRSDTERFYRAADVFVLPSAYEAFSLVCLEAAASGLPLVLPPISGSRELVGDDEAGIIVERDVAHIAAAIGGLARHVDRRVALGAEARRRALRFTWESSAAAVADLYHSLLVRGHR